MYVQAPVLLQGSITRDCGSCNVIVCTKQLDNR